MVLIERLRPGGPAKARDKAANSIRDHPALFGMTGSRKRMTRAQGDYVDVDSSRLRRTASMPECWGKLIGVYLGRPFEDGPMNASCRSSGRSDYYVNERRDVKLRSHHLVVTDDDVSAPSSFRARWRPWLSRTGFQPSRSAGMAQLHRRGALFLWWRHRQFDRNTPPICDSNPAFPAPQSGSIALNGKSVARADGAQIFIDGWAMVSPGNPEQAVYLAQQAGSGQP